jgi:hypothetical protein
MVWGARRGNGTIVAATKTMERPMPKLNDLSRSLIALEQDATLIVVIEMGQSSWLVSLPKIQSGRGIRLETQNHRMIRADACGPVLTRNVVHRPVQVAPPA